jgi:superkiller protein 3
MAHGALPNSTLENAVRAFLSQGAGGVALALFDPRLHGALLSRAVARLTAATGAAAAVDVLDEAEALVSMCGDGGGAVPRIVLAAALEAAAGLDLGLGAEEEGWEEQLGASHESRAESEVSLERRVAALLSHGTSAFPSVHDQDPTVAVAAAWLTLSSHGVGVGAGAAAGAGRSGRAANLPGSAAAAAALPPAARAVLLQALTRGDASSGVTTAASAAAAAAAPPPLGLGATALGWGALAEAALMADDPSGALDAARRGLRAVRAVATAATSRPPLTMTAAAAKDTKDKDKMGTHSPKVIRTPNSLQDGYTFPQGNSNP